MDLETLKQLLKDGVITQAQFDKFSTDIGGKADAEQDEPIKSEADDPVDAPADKPDLETLVQKAVDRATNKLGNDNKKLKEDLEKERKKNLSAEELKVVELKEKENEIVEREQTIKDKENRLYAISALKKAKLDSGDEESLELVDFVIGEDETAIDLKVKALQKFEQRVRKLVTDEIYKTNGRTPEKGGSQGAEINPYKTGNLTMQMELEKKNPEEAKRLELAARAK